MDEMRVHSDDRDDTKAKAILVALVRSLNDLGVKPGLSELYKSFYLAHLIHAKDHGAILSDWPIVKMPRGPGVDDGKRMLEALAEQHVLSQVEVDKETRLGYEYEIVDGDNAKALLNRLNDEERSTIRAACEMIGDSDANTLSRWSHEFSRAWNAAEVKDELAIYVDLLEDEDSDELAERLRDTRLHLEDVFRS